MNARANVFASSSDNDSSIVVVVVVVNDYYLGGILLLAPTVTSLQQLLHVCETELAWLDNVN